MPDKRPGRRGNAIIEFTLFVPWIVFLFVGALDMGFYINALISIQASARAAAIYCGKSSSQCTTVSEPCTTALNELQNLPNVTASLPCTSDPVTVTPSVLTTAQSPDGVAAAQVSVQYHTAQMIPIPGVLSGQLYLTRTVTIQLPDGAPD